MENNEAERVRALGAVLAEFDLDAIRLKIGDSEYELIRREPGPAVPVGFTMPMPSLPALSGVPVGQTTGAEAPAAGPAAAPASAKRVTAPVVGVYYSASSPGADPFVSVGERVSVGQTLCILEAMKLMNEITSDYAGVVTRILPQNGELVALGEDLFWIEP